MSVQIDEQYSHEQRAALERVIQEGNRALEQMWSGHGPKYHVLYLELGAARYDDHLDEMVVIPLEFLAADARSSG